MKSQSLKNNQAFTIIELMVVVGIILLLGSVILVSLSRVKMTARDTKRTHDIYLLRDTLSLYELDNGGFPTCISQNGICYGNELEQLFSSYGIAPSSMELQELLSTKIEKERKPLFFTFLKDANADAYIKSVPKDPINTGAFVYYYKTSAPDPVLSRTFGKDLSRSACLWYTSEIKSDVGNIISYGLALGESHSSHTECPMDMRVIGSDIQPVSRPNTSVPNNSLWLPGR